MITRIVPPPHISDIECNFVRNGWCPYCCPLCEYETHECPDCGVPLDHTEHDRRTGKLHPICGGNPDA